MYRPSCAVSPAVVALAIVQVIVRSLAEIAVEHVAIVVPAEFSIVAVAVAPVSSVTISAAVMPSVGVTMTSKSQSVLLTISTSMVLLRGLAFGRSRQEVG